MSKYYPSIHLDGLRKPIKNLTQEIQIGLLPNTSWEQCHLTFYSLPVPSTAENSVVHCILITQCYISHKFHMRLDADQDFVVNISTMIKYGIGHFNL
jgi:hypothetical protein